MGNRLEQVSALLHPGWLTTVGGDFSQWGWNKKANKKIALNIATWNIHTFNDQDDTDKRHRRTALITSELARYKIDIATLSKTRLEDKKGLTEKSLSYSFFWSGHAPNDKRKAGVGYAIKISLVGKLACHLTMRLPLHHRKKFATIISAYAPTIINTDEIKDKFYENFKYVISAVPIADKIINLGDFNAKVGQDSGSWEWVLSKHGTGKCNNNSLLFLQTCAKHNLLITNTVFRLPTRNKISWMHPCSKHWHLIDYVIVRWRERQDVSHQGCVWCRMLDRSLPNHF